MASVVRKISAEQGRRLRGQLDEAQFEMRDAPHAVWAAKGPGVSVTLYNSGKLLAQGKGAEDFAAAYLDDPDELLAPAKNKADRVEEPVIGTDESGKGDYFGPLVVAAVLIRPEDVPILRMLGVRDSKTVGDAEAATLAEQITEAYPTRVEVVEVMPPRYNELYESSFGRNLNRMLAWGHARAIESLLEREPCGHAISDKFGNERLIEDALMERGRKLDLVQRVRAESHPAVAAASIVARARFLRRLRELGRDLGVKLRKGAGAPVDAVARELFRDGGLERLRGVAKLHFKTTQKAMRSP